MKIKKIEKDSCGRYDLAELPDKINEIIDLLNNSFITQDPNIVYEQVVDNLTSITVDRLTPLSNELATLSIDYDNNIAEGKVLPISNRKCPKCGKSYYTVGHSYSTCVYYQPVYKDGVNINPDRNKSTTSYTCCECGHRWEE